MLFKVSALRYYLLRISVRLEYIFPCTYRHFVHFNAQFSFLLKSELKSLLLSISTGPCEKTEIVINMKDFLRFTLHDCSSRRSDKGQ